VLLNWTTKVEEHSKDVGKRIYALRKHLLLSRKEFCRKHNIPEPLLRGLELSLFSINEKYIQKLLEAFKSENIVCTEEWLLHGTGPAPILNND
jgi:transcriptional regulator with XRE-family HTH domain